MTQATKSYGLWVGGVEVTSANASNIKGSGISGKATYDATTRTLSLNNAKIASSNSVIDKGSFTSVYKYGIYSPNGALTVKLTGSNELTVGETASLDSGFEYVCGIRAPSVKFTGDGSLSVKNVVKNSSSAVARTGYGLWIGGSLTVASGATVNAASTVVGKDRSYAVQADNMSVKGRLTARASSGSGRTRAVYITYSKGLSIGKAGKITATANSNEDAVAVLIQENSAPFTIDGYLKCKAASTNGSGEGALGIVSGKINLSATGELEACGDGGALSDSASIKLATGKSSVLAGNNASSAKKTTAAKAASQRYIHVTAPKQAAKKANTMTAKAKTVTFKYAKVKKKAQAVKATKAFTVKKAKGKVTYKVAKYVTKAAKGKVKVASNGKVTVKKGAPKKTYKLKVKVTAAGNASYKAKSKAVTLVVKVK